MLSATNKHARFYELRIKLNEVGRLTYHLLVSNDHLAYSCLCLLLRLAALDLNITTILEGRAAQEDMACDIAYSAKAYIIYST